MDADKPVKKGRRRYKPKEVALALLKAKGIVSLAAQILGCGVRTVYDHIERDEKVAQVREEALEGMLDLAEAKLYNAISSSQSWAVTFFLARKGRGRGYGDKMDVTSGGNSIRALLLADDEDESKP